MVFTDDVADDTGAFLETGAGIELQQAHCVEEPPMYRLQPVAHIRQRAVHDRRQRIGEITLLQRLAQIDRLECRPAESTRFPYVLAIAKCLSRQCGDGLYAQKTAENRVFNRLRPGI